MQSHHYQDQSRNPSYSQSYNTFAQNNRDSKISNRSNSSNSRRKIFQEPQSTNNQTHYQPESTFQSIRSNVNSANHVVSLQNQQILVASKQLPPKPINVPATDNSKNVNRLSERTFTQPFNFERKTMIKPSIDHTVINQSKTKQKLEALARLKYLNPLARLDYEDRELEVYTKISKQTQQQAMKKIKARNQLANFEQDPIDQQKEIDDLIEFKLGKTGRNGFITHFEKQESVILDQPRQYCTACETFVPISFYKPHIQNCKFEYSQDKVQRNYELQDKINRVYKHLLEQDESETNQVLKKYLVELSTANDQREIQALRQNIQRLGYDGELRVLASRVAQLLKVKISIL